jgi:glyoxylase-like metal-dependent hydrolase (beta-lactamase superfamily II)
METIVPGVAVRLDADLVRITAPNPGVMTGPGTNTYILGRDELILIDPGPDIPAHREQLLELVGDRLKWIVCTHTHLDHSPGAQALKQLTGASIGGMSPPQDGRQDQTFAPDRLLRDGDVVACAGAQVTAVHTPGHASNHLCYHSVLKELLFTGDHVMQGSTVVISPPDGDMHAYLASLARLPALELKAFAPGHGHLIQDPRGEVERLIAHRLKRERKVFDALASATSATLDELVPRVYDDVSPKLFPVARRSLHAHLLKLVQDARVSVEGEVWRVRR